MARATLAMCGVLSEPMNSTCCHGKKVVLRKKASGILGLLSILAPLSVRYFIDAGCDACKGQDAYMLNPGWTHPSTPRPTDVREGQPAPLAPVG